MMEEFSNKVHKKTIEKTGFTSEEISQLVNNNIIRKSGGFYCLNNISTIYDYAKTQIQNNNFPIAEKCLKLCIYVNPYYYEASLTLFNNAVLRGDFDDAVTYLRLLLNCKKEPYSSSYRTYLYIMSMISDLPNDLKARALILEKSDLRITKEDMPIMEMGKQQEIRVAIYAQKFSYARQLVKVLRNENPFLKKSLFILQCLLASAANDQASRRAKLEELVREDSIDEALNLLESAEGQHQISLMDKYLILVLKDLKFLRITGHLPERERIKVPEPNIYDYIYIGNYEKARQLLESYDKMGNVALSTLISKITDLTNQKQKTLKS